VTEDALSDVRVLAEAVADVLEERGLVPTRQHSGRVLPVAEVAGLLGRSRAWVYAHAAELGAVRFGVGPKARLGFDRDAIERWKRAHQIERPPLPPAATRRRGPQRNTKNAGGVELIPYDPTPRGA
jgi:hypothetical protein